MFSVLAWDERMEALVSDKPGAERDGELLPAAAVPEGPVMAHGPRATTPSGDRSTADPSREPTGGDAPTARPPVCYVLVVHGIGRQLRNSTLLGAIDGFASAAAGPHSERGFVDASRISEGEPWTEFDGIPPIGPAPRPFMMTEPPADHIGENLRFVEVHWSKITDDAQHGEDPGTDVWFRGLLKKLAAHQSTGGASPRPDPVWLVHLLYRLRPIVRIVRVVTRRFPKFDRVVFGAFLGDVRMYCESPDVRSRAVGYFHRCLEQLRVDHAERDADLPYEVLVLAHSLGSVLALDALSYPDAAALARFQRDAYEGGFRIDPRPGAQIPPVPDGTAPIKGASAVRVLCTIGSAIEKIHALWPENLTASDRSSRAPEVRHLNLVEAQDMVADPLVVATTHPDYRRLVQTGELQLVAVRARSPLQAHTSYWSDHLAFAAIREFAWGSRNPQWPSDTKCEPRAAVFGHLALPLLWTPVLVALASLVTWGAGAIAGAWGCVVAGVAGLAFGATAFLAIVSVKAATWWSRLVRERLAIARGLPPDDRLPQTLSGWWWLAVVSAAFWAALASAQLRSPTILATIPLAVCLVVGAWFALRLSKDRDESFVRMGRSGAVGRSIAWITVHSLLLGLCSEVPGVFHEGTTWLQLVPASIGVCISLELASRASAVPETARRRAPRVGALISLRSWITACALWVLSPQVFGWARTAAVQSTRDLPHDSYARAVSTALDRWLEALAQAPGFRTAIPFVVAATTVFAALLTAARAEYLLAIKSSAIRRWTGATWNEYAP